MTEDHCPGRVLVVDDEEAMVALLTGWIETLGFAIESAANGAEALEVARRLRPDVILMDAMMPVMGGFEALLALKRDPELWNIPVLFLTVRGDVQDVVNALDIGATDYLTKPFKPQELLARLRSVVRQKQQQDELRSEALRTQQECEQLRSWVENLPVGFLGLDERGVASSWNRRAREATGVEGDRILGRPAGEVLRVEGACPWTRGVPYEGPVTFLAGAAPLPAQAKGEPVPAETGGGYALLLTFP